MNQVVDRLIAAKERAALVFDSLRLRKRDFEHTFKSPSGQAVLKDLARFCRVCTPCYEGDRDLHLIAEGRREVFLRIAQHLNLSPDDLFTLYRGGTVRQLVVETDDDGSTS